jgi:hypothetical protein
MRGGPPSREWNQQVLHFSMANPSRMQPTWDSRQDEKRDPRISQIRADKESDELLGIAVGKLSYY